MKLDVSKKVLDKARRSAKKYFPIETYGYLLGRVRNGKGYITDIYIPKDISEHCDTDGVDVPKHWATEVDEYCKLNLLAILGDIHSHPYTAKEISCKNSRDISASPSEEDYEDPGMGGIQGIIVVLENKNGSLSTRVKLYGPQVQLQIKIK